MSLFPLFLDETLVVVDKPAGLPSVPGRPAELHDCMASRVQAEVPDALVVHRLDMATSGLLVFARSKAAQRALGAAFARRDVAKRYVAVVAGEMHDDEGEIDLPLIADWPNRPLQKVDNAMGKPSVTRYRVIARQPGRTRVALMPVTGRSHQLRVHLQALGHPIVGDGLYAPPEVAAQSPRLLLHAHTLAFAHPLSGEALSFESPLPF
ncbi:RluA family pseudouridine synthase [Piscinibacter sp. HJYY11]|uniref:RluA family pseudouridine synthase n=1 Tax=Piscinibacter sp. HJYY11 TaxID=2801333 RepID=UPI00191D94D5|nr:RluA family pseudouridine synthase [Piscinibacter sp. HJYY11]MBL0727428.1 RluA family pseudouridine synthase [Piscinibacter sp. HJYY11]